MNQSFAFVPVPVPSNQTFLIQWHAWIHGKVARHFKRDKERILDTAQNVRLRLLSKDFIGRWFFKHLRDELVDRNQAEVILGGFVPLVFVGSILPVDIPNLSCLRSKLASLGLCEDESDAVCEHICSGRPIKSAPYLDRVQSASALQKLLEDRCIKQLMHGHGCPRTCENSIWRVSDLLDFAKFDYERYYYSAQGHSIDSDKVLRLLGCEPGRYSVLQSLYRQGKLLPSELTDHDCKRRGVVGAPPSSCPGCERAIALLRDRGLSLADDWMGPSSAEAAKLRWNDSQLVPFLRDWKKTNIVFSTPHYIMRKSAKPGIIAGLLKYAEMIIDHEVYNDFKRMARSDDLSCSVLNKAMSPEFSDAESIAWEVGGDDSELMDRVIRDVRSLDKFAAFENAYDLARLLEVSGLSEEEADVVRNVDLGGMTVREYADKVGRPVPKIHRIRSAAMHKLRDADVVDARDF